MNLMEIIEANPRMIANGEVDAPGHDDEELGHGEEKYQHAVE